MYTCIHIHKDSVETGDADAIGSGSQAALCRRFDREIWEFAFTAPKTAAGQFKLQRPERAGWFLMFLRALIVEQTRL